MFSTMYGPGVLNDTIIPGYGVTKFPVNLPAFWGLGNLGTLRAFGQQNQYVTYPQGYDPSIYALAKDFTSPNHISNWNPMLYGVMDASQNITNPALMEAGLNAASQWGANLGASIVNNMNINEDIQTLSSLAYQISGIMSSDKLTDAQKEKLEAIVEKIKKLQEEYAKAKATGASQETITALRTQLKELITSAEETVKEITEEIKESEGKADNSEGSEDADGTEGAGKTEEDGNGGKKAGQKRSQEEQKEVDFALTQVCHKIDKAIAGAGTNYDDNDDGLLPQMKNACTKDYVLDLFDAWEKSYAKNSRYSSDGKGFIESLMDDCEGDQKEEIALIIVDALEQKAYELGIDVSKEIAAAREAAKSNWIGWRNDDAICDTVNALRNKVKDGAAKQVSEADKKDDAKKAEDKKKADEKKAKEAQKEAEAAKKREENVIAKKNQFVEDMREILGDDKAELSEAVEVVKDEKGNFKGFKIRIQGKDYTGKDYLALAKAIKDAGYEPEKYFKKVQLKQAA